MKQFRSLVLLLLFITFAQPITAQDVVPENFDEWMEAGMEQWDIPGIGVAIVHEGEIAFAEGFGIQKLGNDSPVNRHTQFGIASVSKHMTASSLAILVDEGLVNWEDPVTKHIPWFQLSDPWATANVTIHDLLTHQVGIGRMMGNRLQYMTDRSREEMLYRMRYHDFEEDFRSAYVYSNVMYTLAGEIVAAVTDQTWDEFMAERFFRPMDMRRTNTSINDLDEENAAWPHQYINGEVVEIPRRSWDNAAPAGGVNSTPADFAKWMQLQLGIPGTYNSIEYISEESVTEIQTPKVSHSIPVISSPQNSYGYGFSITDYKGYRLISHGGATDGMNTTYILIPELDFGIIVMSNVFNTFRQAVAYTVIDHILGENETDWNQIYYESYINQYESVKNIREAFEATRIEGTTPTHDLENYAGRFHNDLYETAEISYNGDNLRLMIYDIEELSADLEHWHHNTFRIIWDNPALREDFLQFHMNLEGEIDSAEIRFTLRPMMLQVGSYPTNYYRDVMFERVEE